MWAVIEGKTDCYYMDEGAAVSLGGCGGLAGMGWGKDGPLCVLCVCCVCAVCVVFDSCVCVPVKWGWPVGQTSILLNPMQRKCSGAANDSAFLHR